MRRFGSWPFAIGALGLLLAGGCGGSSFLNPVLNIKGLTPALGPSAGGTSIKIVGAGFVESVTEVRFGEALVAAEDVEFISTVELRVDLPPLPDDQSLGVVDVTVTNVIADEEQGETVEEDVLRSSFTYFAATVAFDSYRNVLTPDAPFTGILADVDVTGLPDVIVAHRGESPGISRFLGRGDGSFDARPVQALRGGPFDPGSASTRLLRPNLLLADRLDQDFAVDLAVTVLADTAWRIEEPEIAFLRGFGNGEFELNRLIRAEDIGSGGSLGDDLPTIEPTGIASGDLDEDGRTDLIVAYTRSDRVAVFFGDGAGGYSHVDLIAAGQRPVDVEIADLNGDQVLDFAVTNSRDDTVSVFYGLRGGAFREADESPFDSGAQPLALATGQFNGDQLIDLVTVNTRGGSISILEADGFGGFLEPRRFQTDRTPTSLATADLDGNGLMDIAVANSGSSTLTLFFQTSRGEFAQETLATGKGPQTVLAGTIVQDAVALPDLASVNSRSNHFSVHQNLGDGIFDQPRILGSGLPRDFVLEDVVDFDQPSQVIPADFDGDRVEDLLIVDSGRDEVVFLKGSPDGEFRESSPPITPLAAGVIDAAGGDVDGDGLRDLVVAFESGEGLGVLFGRGDGTFSPLALRDVLVDPHADRVELADVQGDEGLEVIVTNSKVPVLQVLSASGGTGLAPVDASLLSALARDMAIADFDRDRRPDAAILLADPPTLEILLGDGSGGFSVAQSIPLDSEPTALVSADFDRDSDVDLAVASRGAQTIQVFSNPGDLPFGPLPAQGSVVALDRILAVDVDGDSAADLVGLDRRGNQLLVFRSSAGVFDPPLFVGVTDDPRDLAPLRSGSVLLPDIVVAGGRPGAVSIARNISF